MTQQDAFTQKLSALLNDAPAGYSLPEYQALYRQLIFTFGLQILQKFPLQAGLNWHQPDRILAGAENSGANAATGGQGAGPHPKMVGPFLDFPAFVLGLTP